MIHQLNHYEALGISQTSTASEIRSAYRSLALRFHPDKHSDTVNATTVFKRINEAYEILNNEERRNTYDLTLYMKNFSDDTTFISEDTESTGFDSNFEEEFQNFRDYMEKEEMISSQNIQNMFLSAENEMLKTLLSQLQDQKEQDNNQTRNRFGYTIISQANEDAKITKQEKALSRRSHKISKAECSKIKVKINKKSKN